MIRELFFKIRNKLINQKTKLVCPICGEKLYHFKFGGVNILECELCDYVQNLKQFNLPMLIVKRVENAIKKKDIPFDDDADISYKGKKFNLGDELDEENYPK